MIALKKTFTDGELRWFGPLFLLFSGMIGAVVRWRFDSPQLATWVWALGGATVVVYYLFPQSRRTIFMAWLGAVYPIGWVLSHILLGVVFYFVVLPIGLLLRLARYDPLTRKFDQKVTSYWIEREPSSDPRKYFRQS